jgi:beta-1,4-mannosyl-glycoprotein beta-1,4-N-acetylglucosaminyltransferase
MTYDCFTFFNELDLLEIRLNVLDPVVDKFVLVEATRTHQNKPKPLHYKENADRFKSFRHKIIHIIVDEYPAFGPWKEAHSWILERYQRNCISRGLTQCQPEDVVMVSDLDEIPNPEMVRMHRDKKGIKVFEQRNFYYFMNFQNCNEPWWYGSVMAKFREFRKPQELRSVSKKMHGEKKKILNNKIHRIVKAIIHPIYRNHIYIIPSSGWHFSYLGGVDKIIEKLEAFAHTEYNKEKFKDREALAKALKEGTDFVGQGASFLTVPMDEAYPRFVLEHRMKYQHLIR